MTRGNIVAIAAFALVCFIAGAGIAAKVTASSVTQTADTRTSREARILAWIVERNPEATIKDFSTFPTILLGESERAGIDYRLILAMADKESRMNPRAVGQHGEVGLLQILPSTAALVAKRLDDKSYKPPLSARDKKEGMLYSSLGSLGDPRVNVRYGIEYLRWQIEQFGVTPTAIRAYNRNPDRATEFRPQDRYAEDVALSYLVLVQRFN